MKIWKANVAKSCRFHGPRPLPLPHLGSLRVQRTALQNLPSEHWPKPAPGLPMAEDSDTARTGGRKPLAVDLTTEGVEDDLCGFNSKQRTKLRNFPRVLRLNGYDEYNLTSAREGD